MATNVLLLASVFIFFREVCYLIYALGCTYSFTASNPSGTTFQKPDLKPLTHFERLHVKQRMTRGDISSVYARRLYKANKNYIVNVSPSEQSSFIIEFYASKLYGGIMKHCPLPLNDFSIIEKRLEVILLTSENSEGVLKLKSN